MKSRINYYHTICIILSISFLINFTFTNNYQEHKSIDRISEINKELSLAIDNNYILDSEEYFTTNLKNDNFKITGEYIIETMLEESLNTNLDTQYYSKKNYSNYNSNFLLWLNCFNLIENADIEYNNYCIN
jgi:hypothetical protein